MATYFHGPQEMQPDGLQTLLLMNPGHATYTADATAPTGMIFLNSSLNSLNPSSISLDQHQHQHLVGVPLQGPTTSVHGQHNMATVPAVHGTFPRVHYNMPPAQQGLSLSLSPQRQQQQNYSMYWPEDVKLQQEVARMVPRDVGKDSRLSGAMSPVPAMSNGIQSLLGVLMGSKYLKVTQQLLEEVVNIGKEVKDESPGKMPKKLSSKKVEEGDGDTTSGKPAAELSAGERQELQMKKAKLVHMLDEVEQRYKQYDHQMQAVISSFESIAGIGSARTYTAVALRTISKQFRCLRDTICNQIRITGKSLGEEEYLQVLKLGGGSRLRFINDHLRQQRALQQLGMMQHNAWRPQRGLPEHSVSVLRAWLFEHFLHPYPKDSDKIMLAKQTGLTRNQVSNWFINARVRLWKPMVEEMYLEEMKDRKRPNNLNPKEDDSLSKSSALLVGSSIETEQSNSFDNDNKQDEPSPPAILQMQPQYDDTEEMMLQPSLKKARANNSPTLHTMTLPVTMEMEMKPHDTNHSDLFMGFGDHSYNLNLLTSGTYPTVEIGRYSTNGVSLTLGLPRSTPQPSYLSGESYAIGRRFGMGTEANEFYNLNNSNSPTASHSQSPYDSLGIQNRKNFAAQLLPDFVA